MQKKFQLHWRNKIILFSLGFVEFYKKFSVNVWDTGLTKDLPNLNALSAYIRRKQKYYSKGKLWSRGLQLWHLHSSRMNSKRYKQMMQKEKAIYWSKNKPQPMTITKKLILLTATVNIQFIFQTKKYCVEHIHIHITHYQVIYFSNIF